MKKITLATMGLCMLTITSCGTSQGNGALIGTGAGAALGAIVGKIAGNTAVGAAIGGAVGAGTGAIIGRHMDKVKAEAAAKVQNAKVEEVTDANGLKAVKLTFDSGLQFDLNKSTLRAAAKKDLINFASVLKHNTDCLVDIQGYTDATGGDKINVPLSQSRAQAVSIYLVSQGVSSSQFKNVAGYGSQNPIVDKTVAPQNRRVEVYLYASPEMVQKAENGTLK